LLGRVRVPLRSPTSSLLLGPPTSHLLRPPLWSPSLRGPPQVEVLLLNRPSVHLGADGASEIAVRLPVGLNSPRKGEALPGCWVVPLERAAVCDPAERTLTSPLSVMALLPSGHVDPLGARKLAVSRLCSRGPRPCVPTYHPATSLPPEQGSLPACRARLWPDRFRACRTTARNFMNHRMIQSFPTSLAWSHQRRA